MSNLLIESYSHYAFADITTKGWSSPTGGSFSTGRFAGNCLAITSGVSAKALPSTYNKLYWGFAFKISVTGTAQTVADLQTNAGTHVADVKVTAANQVALCLAAGTQICLSTVTPIVANTWIYIEVCVFVNGASGTGELRVPGETIGPNTGNFGSTNMAIVETTRGGGSGTVSYCDMYVNDTSGSVNTGFLGDSRVDLSTVSANGTTNNFTPSASTNNTNVDDATPNGDTDYNSDGTLNDLDLFATTDAPSGTSAISAIQVNHYARKTDAGPRSIATVFRQGGTNYVNAASKALFANYAYQSQIYDLDPLGSAWTASTYNSDEVGVKITV